MLRAKAAALSVTLILGALSTSASASIVVQFTGITADNNFLCPGPSNGYRWSYSATISGGESNGSFTIYDFPGTICTVEAESGAASAQLLGDTPTGLSPPDDPTLSNVTVSSINNNDATLTHTYFTDIILMTSTPLSLVYTWQDSTFAGVPQSGGGTVGPASAVPEPVTVSLFGAGLAGAVAMRRRRKKLF